MVMNVTGKILMEYEHSGRLECDAVWSTKEHTVRFQKTNPECWSELCLDNPLVSQRVNWFQHCQAILRIGFSDECPAAPD
jgi:hypothetical protein